VYPYIYYMNSSYYNIYLYDIKFLYFVVTVLKLQLFFVLITYVTFVLLIELEKKTFWNSI